MSTMKTLKIEEESKTKKPVKNASNQKSILVERKITNITDKRVYSLLSHKGPMTRNQLVNETGIPRSTLYDSLNRLKLMGLIEQFSKRVTGPGRPKIYFQVIDSDN